jgi:flagellar biogenesis protein FliO
MRHRKMANRSHAACGSRERIWLIAVEQLLYLIAGQPRVRGGPLAGSPE